MLFEVFQVTFDPVYKLIEYLAHGLIVWIMLKITELNLYQAYNQQREVNARLSITTFTLFIFF